jgi:hypothetical protein
LSTESFNLANDPTVFPDQLKLVETTTRQFLILLGGFMVAKKFDAADKTNLVTFKLVSYFRSIKSRNQP